MIGKVAVAKASERFLCVSVRPVQLRSLFGVRCVQPVRLLTLALPAAPQNHC